MNEQDGMNGEKEQMLKWIVGAISGEVLEKGFFY